MRNIKVAFQYLYEEIMKKLIVIVYMPKVEICSNNVVIKYKILHNESVEDSKGSDKIERPHL